MSAITDLQENLEGMQTARFVTTMLRDISATKLQTIRAAFKKNRAFYDEMNELDALVETYALRKRRKNAGEEALPEEKGKQIFVALTSNKRFSGTLNRDITQRLIDRFTDDPNAAGLIIGETGRQYMKKSEQAGRCSYLSFEGDEPTPEEAAAFIKRLSEYENIFIFYPTFINSFRQEVALIDITHTPTLERGEEKTIDYIFEPDISLIHSFFETQVRLILFNRVLLETKLALTGARFSKMQRARERAGELVKKERRTIHKELMALQSMRLLETFAGFQKK